MAKTHEARTYIDQAYLLADPVFYDRIEEALTGADADDLAMTVTHRLPAMSVTTEGIWARALPAPGAAGLATLPAHGWKLHCSAQPDQALTVLEAVLAEFEVAPFAFKVLRDTRLVTTTLARWWPRGQAGKFIAIYPTDRAHARQLAQRLADRLSGVVGPYILTDRPVPGSRCVFYRYGGIHRSTGRRADGSVDVDLVGPDGQRWTDARAPRYTRPPWVAEDLFPDADDATGTGLDDGAPAGADPSFFSRYTIVRALNHNTAGGVYLATTAAGEQVVIKEARPHTAFSPDGLDAVGRLEREYAVLQALAAVRTRREAPVAPRPVELATVWQHRYLVEEFVPGITLQRWMARSHPDAQGLGADGWAAFGARARDLVDQLAAALEAVETSGLVYSDASPMNMLIDAEDHLRLVDFESCDRTDRDPETAPRTAGYHPAAGTPAHSSARGWHDVAVGAVEACCLGPYNGLLSLSGPTFARAQVHLAATRSWPLTGMWDRLSPGVLDLPALGDVDTTTPATAQLAHATAAGIAAAATPDRAQRLFPGDVAGFGTHPAAVAHGAAGVLRMLHAAGTPVPARWLSWLTDRVGQDAVGKQLPAGLYTGAAGVGVALLELGRPELGAALLDAAADHISTIGHEAGFGVADGAAGVGLGLLAGADVADRGGRTQDADRWVQRAAEVAGTLWSNAHTVDGLPPGAAAPQAEAGWVWSLHPQRAIGHLHGSSGVAGFFLALAERTGDDSWLPGAIRAVQADLAQGRRRANGGIGYRAHAGDHAYEPYFVRGGAGVGMAIAALARATGQRSWMDTLQEAVTGIGTGITINAGLFAGMTGVAEFFSDAADVLPGDERTAALLEESIAMISALRVQRPVGVLFPGTLNRRLSCDVATGAAGVLGLLLRRSNGGRTLDLRQGRSLPGLAAIAAAQPRATAAGAADGGAARAWSRQLAGVAR